MAENAPENIPCNVSNAAIQLRNTLVSISYQAQKAGVPLDTIAGAYAAAGMLTAMNANNAMANAAASQIAVAGPGDVPNLRMRNNGQ